MRHSVHGLWDRSSERFLDAGALTRPQSLRLLDLGFYSSVITGWRCNVKLSVAKLFSTPLKRGGERKGLNAGHRLLHQPHFREPVSQRDVADKTATTAKYGDA